MDLPYYLSRRATRSVEGIPSALKKRRKFGVLRDELRELGIASDAVRGIRGGPHDHGPDDGTSGRE